MPSSPASDRVASPVGKVFISHASSDKAFVDRLAYDLSRHGVSVWYDKLDLRIGDSIPGKINEGLLSSKYFLVVLSPRSVLSRWVQEELNAALITAIASSGTFLIPVLYEDCQIPPLIKHRRFADFRVNYDDALKELLQVFGKDAEISASVSNKALYPWPNTKQEGPVQCYLHSTRFDKFFRMDCDLVWTANTTIDYIVNTLKLPWAQQLPQLGMRWSFTYGLIFDEHGIPLSTRLEDAGVSNGSVLRLNIRGTYEDLAEKELREMWDGSKIYEIGGAMRRDAELRALISRRGALTAIRLREIANSCFSHL